MLNIKVIASGSKGNCYLIANDLNEKLLIECGVSFKKILSGINFDIANLKGCLVTHEHKDHSFSIKQILGASIDVYASLGTGEACGVTNNHRFRTLVHKQPTTIGSYNVLPLNAVHDAKEPLMFVIRSGKDCLLFATDTMYIRYKIPGITHVMIEANYDTGIITDNTISGSINNGRRVRTFNSHMNLDTCKEVFRTNKWQQLEKIILIHLSNENSDEQKFIEEVEKITGIPVEVA